MPDDRKKPLKFPTDNDITGQDESESLPKKDLPPQEDARAFIMAQGMALLKKQAMIPGVAGTKALEMMLKIANFGFEPPKKKEPIEIQWVEIEQDDDGKIIRKQLA